MICRRGPFIVPPPLSTWWLYVGDLGGRYEKLFITRQGGKNKQVNWQNPGTNILFCNEYSLEYE